MTFRHNFQDASTAIYIQYSRDDTGDDYAVVAPQFMCAFLAGEMFGSLLLNSFFGQGVHHGVIESQSLGQLANKSLLPVSGVSLLKRLRIRRKYSRSFV